MDDIMTVEEVSKYLRICEKTVYHLAKQGSLPVTGVGNDSRFYRSEIDQMLKRLSTHMKHILVIDDAPVEVPLGSSGIQHILGIQTHLGKKHCQFVH